MTFDPNEYLYGQPEKKDSEFDPNKFLSGSDSFDPNQYISNTTEELDDEALLEQVEDIDSKLSSETRKRQAKEYGKLTLESTQSPEELGLANKKQQIYSTFKNKGYDPNLVNSALAISKQVNAPRYGRMIGAGAAAVGASLLTGGFEPTDLLTMPTVYRTVAAGLGGVGGEATQTGIEERRLISPKEAGKAFLIEAGTELAGSGATTAVKKGILKPLGLVKKPPKGMTIDDLSELQDTFSKYGGKFSPAELDRRWQVKTAEGWSRGAFGAEELWKEMEEAQGNSTRVMADTLIRSITGKSIEETPEILSKDFAASISKGGALLEKGENWFDDLYNKIGEMTKSNIVKKTGVVEVPSSILDESGKPITKNVEKVIGKEYEGATISIRNLKKWASEKLAKNDNMLQVGEEGRNVLFNTEGRTALENILALKDDIGVGEVRKLRTQNLNKTLQYARDVNSDKGLMEEMGARITDTLFNPENAKGFTPEAMNLLKNTNKLYSEFSSNIKGKIWKEALVDTITKNPTKGIDYILPDGNPESIKNMRESLMWPTGKTGVNGESLPIDPEGVTMWNKLRQAKLANMANKIFSEDVVKKGTVNKLFDETGEKTFKELFPEKEITENLSDLKKVLVRVSEKPPTGNSLYVRGMQASGLGMILYGNKGDNNYVTIGAGGALLISPYVFARLAMTRTGTSLLTAGFKNTGSTPITAIGARIVNYLHQQDVVEKKRAERAKNILRSREQIKNDIENYGSLETYYNPKEPIK